MSHDASEQVDELGPVDYLVVEFPEGHVNFTGTMAAELDELVKAGTIRVLDLLVLHKDRDGNVEAFEVDGIDELRGLESEIAEILAAEDVVHWRPPWRTAAPPECWCGKTRGPRRRVRSTSCRWPAHRLGPNTDPSHRCLVRSRCRTDDRRSLTCQYVQLEPHVAA
jgi:hypothetical protein